LKRISALLCLFPFQKQQQTIMKNAIGHVKTGNACAGSSWQGDHALASRLAVALSRRFYNRIEFDTVLINQLPQQARLAA